MEDKIKNIFDETLKNNSFISDDLKATIIKLILWGYEMGREYEREYFKLKCGEY